MGGTEEIITDYILLKKREITKFKKQGKPKIMRKTAKLWIIIFMAIRIMVEIANIIPQLLGMFHAIFQSERNC